MIACLSQGEGGLGRTGPGAAPVRSRRIVPPVLLAVHVAVYAALVGWRTIPAFELFNLLLFAANVFACFVLRRRGNLLVGSGFMVLVIAHTAVGQFIAPDSLTSGAILMTNFLVLYTGVNIYLYQPRRYWYVFLASFTVLFLVFVIWLANAEALFLLFLMGLCATARNFKLLSYFWAITLSFSFFPPYQWEAFAASMLVLTAWFGVRGELDSRVARVFLLAGLVLVLFVLLPLFVMVLNEDFRGMAALWEDARVRAALRTTMVTSVAATGVLALFGVPLAYAVARLEFPGKTFLQALVNVPIVIPQSVAGIALLTVFGRRQFVGETMGRLFGVYFDGTVLGIILAQVFVASPFLIKSAIAAFEGVPVRLEQAARTLGAGPLSAFRRVCLPLAGRGLVLGMILAWARAAGEFGALLFIAPNPETVPVLAFNRFQSLGQAETGPLVALAMIFSLAMFLLLQLVSRALPGGAGKEGAS